MDDCFLTPPRSADFSPRVFRHSRIHAPCPPNPRAKEDPITHPTILRPPPPFATRYRHELATKLFNRDEQSEMVQPRRRAPLLLQRPPIQHSRHKDALSLLTLLPRREIAVRAPRSDGAVEALSISARDASAGLCSRQKIRPLLRGPRTVFHQSSAFKLFRDAQASMHLNFRRSIQSASSART